MFCHRYLFFLLNCILVLRIQQIGSWSLAGGFTMI